MGAVLGYSDTPIIPGSTYHVHDGNRPQPPVISLDPIPSDAVSLFDGSSIDGWKGNEGKATWKIENGELHVLPGSGNIRTEKEFGSCQLHVEFSSPTVVKGEGQGRGNSGIFIMGRYEIQVLDCFENPTYPDGTTGAVYGQYPPLVNAVRKPGEWNIYDIIWEAPAFIGDKLMTPAFVTVILNGIVLHHRIQLQGPTMHRELASYTPHPPVGPLELQDHGDLVRFRNIWYRPLTAGPKSA